MNKQQSNPFAAYCSVKTLDDFHVHYLTGLGREVAMQLPRGLSPDRKAMHQAAKNLKIDRALAWKAFNTFNQYRRKICRNS